MKIIYSFIASLLICVSASAQCSINGSAVPNEDDVSPTAANCPHVQQNVFYDQTIQGRVLSSFDSTITFPISATFTIRVDSVRIDDVLGLPAGITWSRSPIVLPGGAAGCLRFTGTTSAIAGTYPLTIEGTAWVYTTNVPFTPDGPRTASGDLSRYTPYRNYYLVVDGAGLTLVTNSTNVSCNGGFDGTASVTPSGGSNYTYEWNGGFPNMYDSAITGLNARTYTVTVTSGVATATATVTVGEPTAVQAAATSTSSSGSNGTATAAAVGGTPGYTYKWNDNQTTATATGLAPGAYFVTVTDSKGCTATASTVVVAGSGGVSVSLSKTDVACFGGNNGSVTATASGGGTYTYAWSNNGGNVATISGLTPGTYAVTVTSNGSSATASINVTAPSALTASATSTPSTGSNGTADVTATGGTPGYTYIWSGSGQTGPSISGLASGTYNVTVTDTKGCTATASTFVASGTSNFNLSITKADVTCFGAGNGLATANVTGSGTPTYSWSNNQTTASISGLSPGNYSVTVTLNGNTLTASVTIAQPAVITATATSTASSGSNGIASVNVSGGTPPYTYSWSSGPTTDTITGLAPGAYTVIVSDSRNCTSSATTTVVVTGITDIEANYTLSIFPNPANDVVNVTAAIPAGEVNVRVLNLAGQVVYMARQNSSGNYKATINCDGFTAGVYVLELSAANQIARNRFVIAK